MSALSRRGFARFAVRLAALWATGAEARNLGSRGLGGAGAVFEDPEETVGQDRGIGGTGVVGTIRDFGSIWVNDLRVSYPGNASVTIDGVRAAVANLRIGQVVQVLAHPQTGVLATPAISITHEVVGPVEAFDPTSLTVLGQQVLAGPALRGRLRLGQTVAISGLRRLDGSIDASLIEPRPSGTPARLAGPVRAAPDGSLRIGGLDVSGLQPSLVGRRVVLAGRRVRDTFRISAVRIESAVPFTDADRLSIEGYPARDGDTIRFGSGLTLAAGMVGAELGDEDALAIVTATVDEHGVATATDISFQRRAHHGMRGVAPRASGQLGDPGAVGRQRGVGPGSSAGGNGGNGRGGHGGGNR